MSKALGAYPIIPPEISVGDDLDFLLIEPPPRYLPMMPNGIAYVHMLLQRLNLKVQTVDFNIILYHRHHCRRHAGASAPVVLDSGHVLHEDPWSTTGASEFGREDVIDYYWPEFEQLIEAVAAAAPKVVGLSINGDNTAVGRRIVAALRIHSPKTVIVIGGYICVYDYIGPHVFRDYDYMVIGEAEVSFPPLAEALARGERPADLPGILSRWDKPSRVNIQSERPQSIEALGWPMYEWADLNLYQTSEGHKLVPICGSRGCAWSRCLFCGERFPFRKRSPVSVTDEITYFVEKGFDTFHFNESDVNGDPENLFRICESVINRGIKAKFVGQLRVDKRNTADYFKKLKEAGFVHLRFGVDGWSQKILRLQRKGYSMRVVKQNLKDCHEAGIHTTANIVVGVPGESEMDVDEAIENLVSCSPWIDAVESFNALALMAGSEYYLNPDAYKIKFRGKREDIYADSRNMIPDSLWYSLDPYIDSNVRELRIERIIIALHERRVNIGPFAAKVLNDFRNRKRILQTQVVRTPIEGAPSQIRLLRDLGTYNLVAVNNGYLGLFKALGPIDLQLERIGDRDLFPFVVKGDYLEEVTSKIIAFGGDPKDWEISPRNDSESFVGWNLKSNLRATFDFLAWWQMPPFIYGGRTEFEVRAAIGGSDLWPKPSTRC